jgi:hypothetical protein
MVVVDLVVQGKDVSVFFKDFLAAKGQPQWLKSVVPIGIGTRVQFVSEQMLKLFLDLVAPLTNWRVECELTALTVITLAPRGQGRHFLVGDGMVVTMLSRYGEVREGKRLTYRDFPGIENGVRQYKVKLSGKVAVPSVVNFGSASFFVSHRGQVKTCIRCGQAGHLVKECEVVKCFKCGEEGHMAKECSNSVKCSVCTSEGHTFRNCPNTFSGVLKLASRFTKIPASHPEPVNTVEVVSNEGSGDEVRDQDKPEPQVDTQAASDSQCARAAEEVEVEQLVQSQDVFGSQAESVSSASEVESSAESVLSGAVDTKEGERSTRSTRKKAGRTKTTV